MINFISLMPTHYRVSTRTVGFLPNFFFFQPDIFVPFLRHLSSIYNTCESWNVSIVVTRLQIKKTTSSAMSESRSPGSPTSGASTAPPGSCRMLTEVTGATTPTSRAPALPTPNYRSPNYQLLLPQGKIWNVQIDSWDWIFSPVRIPLTGSSSSSRIPTLTPSPSKNVGSHLKSSMESLDDLEWDNEVVLTR